jgi:hypothetical protein
MDRWKQRNSLNLDTRLGMNYLSKIFGAGNSNVAFRNSVVVSGEEFLTSHNGKNRHYAGLQPLSPCWELSDSFSHSRAASNGPRKESNQVAKLRLKNHKESPPKRPYSICGPVTPSHYPNHLIPAHDEFFITPLVQLRQKQRHIQTRCGILYICISNYL